MRFHKTFQKGVSEINARRKEDPRIEDALRRYDRRSLVLKVRGDATYVFHFAKSRGVEYEVDPQKEPDDMYVEMDMEKAEKLVFRHTLGIFDVMSIKYRNIKLADVQFLRKLFEA